MGVGLPDEAMIARAQSIFSDMPKFQNPDGTVGIKLHADIGQACADPTLCGNFGGLEQFDDVAGAEFNAATIKTHLRGARQGLFHWVWYVNCASPQGAQNGMSLRSCADQSLGYRGNTLVHELGHNLGLEHHGPASEPQATWLNAKAIYASIMNYAYQNGMPGLQNGLSRFSEGKFPALDHRYLSENAYASGVDKSIVAGYPYYLPVNVNTVDWNRDGRISETVMFDYGPLLGSRDSAAWPELLQARDIGTAVPSGGGGVVVDPASPQSGSAALYSFMPFAHADGVYPDAASVKDNVYGAAGSWSAWQKGKAPPAGVTLDPDGEVGAASFVSNGGARLALVVMPANDGKLWTIYYSIDGGAFLVWAAAPGWPAGAIARGATVVNVGGKLVVAFRDLSKAENVPNVYLAEVSTGGTFGPWELVNVPSYHTPGLAAGPDGYLYLLHTPVFEFGTSVSIEMKLARRTLATSTGAFTVLDSPSFADPGFGQTPLPIRDRTRLSLVFLPYLVGGGTPFADGSGYLAAFWNRASNVNDTNQWNALRAYTPGYLAPGVTAFGSAVAAVRGQVNVDRPYRRHSIAVTRRWHDVAAIYPRVVWLAPQQLKPPFYQPFAAGTPPQVVPAKHNDYDDAATMRPFLCRSIRSIVGDGASFCP